MYLNQERIQGYFGDEYSYLSNAYAYILITCHKFKYDFAKLMHYDNLEPFDVDSMFPDYSFDDTLFEDLNDFMADYCRFFNDASRCFILSLDTTFEGEEGEYTGDFGDYITATFTPITNKEAIMKESVLFVEQVKNRYSSMRYLENSVEFELPINIEDAPIELEGIKDYFQYLFEKGLLHHEVKH